MPYDILPEAQLPERINNQTDSNGWHVGSVNPFSGENFFQRGLKIISVLNYFYSFSKILFWRFLGKIFI